MACPDFTYHVDGRLGIGVEQPYGGTDFPLIDPSADIRYLLADFWLAYDDPADFYAGDPEFQLPLRLHWLYGFGCQETSPPVGTPSPSHAADLLVVDAAGRTVFDSTQAAGFFSRDWGPRLAIRSWQAERAVCHIVQHTRWSSYGRPAPRDYPLHLLPEQAVLDSRVIQRRPRRLRSLTVLGYQIGTTAIDLQGGYNTEIAYAGRQRQGRRNRSRIVFSAQAGSGLGRWQDCPDTLPPVQAIDGVKPTDSGEFYLQATDCYAVRESLFGSELQVGELVLSNACQPCCLCQDFVDVAAYLKEIRDKWQVLGEQAEAIRDQYHSNLDRWEIAQACFNRHPLRLFLQPQFCPVMDVAAQFCNQGDDCTGPLLLTLDFTGTPLTGEEVKGFTFITGVNLRAGRRDGLTERYELEGAWPVYQAYWPELEPFASAHLLFRLRFPEACFIADAAALQVQACLRGELNGLPIQIKNSSGMMEDAADCVTAELLCPQGDRVDPFKCTLPG